MNVFTDEVRRDPFALYAQMRAVSPVLKAPGTDLFLLFEHADVKRALRDHAAFSSSVGATRGVSLEWLLFLDPPRHTLLRAIVSKAFTVRSIAVLEHRVRKISRDLLDRVIARGEMELVGDYASLLPIGVISEMLGIPSEKAPDVRRWSDAIMDLGNTILGSAEAARAANEAFRAANDEMKVEIGALVEDRRVAPRDDLLTRLALAEVDGERLTDEELLRFVQLLLSAGTETTTNLIASAILCFLDHPGELARVRAEPSLLGTAIEETLRYRSPAQAMFRATRRDIALGGVAIPAETMVITMIGSANRDPKHIADPDRFDVGRDPNPHLAFGHGIHFCLGAPLARLEARVALADLLARMRSFERASSAPWEPRKSFHVHGPTRLPIRFEPAP